MPTFLELQDKIIVLVEVDKSYYNEGRTEDGIGRDYKKVAETEKKGKNRHRKCIRSDVENDCATSYSLNANGVEKENQER